MIDEDLDEALARSPRQGTSKAALIPGTSGNVKPLPPIEEDPLWELRVEGSPDESLSVNESSRPKRSE